VSVKDNGIGISETDLLGIFDPLRKTANKSTAGEKSTGLGLSIVKKLVELHGGKVWVESHKNKGSTFSFVVPLNK
jgi:signal transduction histidine kinase